MKKKNKVLMSALVGALVLTVVACDRDTSVAECLDNPGRPAPIVIVPNPHPYWPYGEGILIPNDTPVDARGYTFTGTSVAFKLNDANPTLTPGTRDNICVVGGTITSNLPLDSTWTTWHTNYGARVQAPNAKLIGQKIHDVGDGIDFKGENATDWQVVGIDASGGGDDGAGAYIHDDCVQNDQMQSGMILDSKFDGCGSSFLSASGNTANPNSGDNEVLVQDTLVRMQAMHESFCPVAQTYSCNPTGYDNIGGFFKFSRRVPPPGSNDSIPPKLRLTRVMLRADQQPPFGGNENGRLSPPPETVCDDVVLINTDTWNPADVQDWFDACPGEVTLGTIADWDDAVSQWEAEHPAL